MRLLIRRPAGAPVPAPPRGVRGLALVLGPVLLAGAAGCSTGSGQPSGMSDDFAAARPVTVGAPSVPPVETADLVDVPAAGTVEVVPGPFTDVLRWESLTLEQGSRPRVTGELSSTADVAPLLRLEVRVAFYDDAGRYLGEGAFVEEGRGDEGVPDTHEQQAALTRSVVEVRPPAALPAPAASARLVVVQYVTE